MTADPALGPLAAACRSSPEDPLARARLLAHAGDLATPAGAELLEALADLARTEEGREDVLEAGLLHGLIARGGTLGAEAEVLTQACRLGGNLCFDSPLGREAVAGAGLLPALAGALALRPWAAGPGHRLWQVLPAFIHNYCADSLASLASVSELLEAVAGHYGALEEEDPSVEAWASCLANLLEHEGKLSLLSRPAVLGSAVHLLHLTGDQAVLQALLDLLQDICEDEAVSGQALELGLLPLLLARLDSGPADPRAACLDLLALLSSHPTAMETLMSPASPLPALLPAWLEGADPRRAATAALIYGNYCTSDSACLTVAQEGRVPATLVTLLRPGSEARLLHAATGCLRNLSVCRAARELLCSLFLPQACTELLLHLAANSDHTVTPKLVGTLRLVTQGEREACRQLAAQPDLLACLVKTSQFSLVPALAIETARLVASVIRYSEDPCSLGHCLEAEGCLALLTSLLNSPHPQLINEVVVVLTVAAAARPPHPALAADLELDFLADRLAATLRLAACPPEVKANVVQLVWNLLLWEGEAVLGAFRGAEGGLREAVEAFDAQSDVARSVLEKL